MTWKPFGATAYSAQTRLVATGVVAAMLLGGGGSPNPATESLLQLIFGCLAVAWLWMALPERGGMNPDRSVDPGIWILVAILILLPVIQLVPVPPSLWWALPGRETEAAALDLVGEANEWRSLSQVPGQTLASLLAIIPAAFSAYAVASLTLQERRAILAVIALMAVLNALLGVIQLMAGDAGFNLYANFHVGWVTGFQANRNAAADVLLIGFLALIAVATRLLYQSRNAFPLALNRPLFMALVGGLALLLLVAIAMTGSRTGILLILVALAGASCILLLPVWGTELLARARTYLIGISVAAGALLLIFIFSIVNSGIGRVTARFSEVGDARFHVWEDSWYALGQFWPFGYGVGGFVEAMLPAERLEYLDPSLPNRAHNDYLELGLEAGLVGYVLLLTAAAACTVMAWRSWKAVPQMRSQIVFGVTVLVIVMLHSFVDYPLRAMVVACLAGVASGMLSRREVYEGSPRPAGRSGKARVQKS